MIGLPRDGWPAMGLGHGRRRLFFLAEAPGEPGDRPSIGIGLKLDRLRCFFLADKSGEGGRSMTYDTKRDGHSIGPRTPNISA